MGKVNWDGDKVRAQIESTIKKRLAACGAMGTSHAKVLLSVDGTGKRETVRDSKGRFLSRLKYGANPSKPGEPPHVQTGRLRGSIAWEVVGLTCRIGTNVKYGRYLELGTSTIAPRPWLRRMLAEKNQAFRNVLTAPIKSGQGK